MQLLLVSVTGFAAGALHVVSGPDHLAALAPIAVEGRRVGARGGLVWGFGHALGVVFLVLVATLAGQFIELERWSGYSELAVGALLLGVGGWAAWGACHGKSQSLGAFHAHGSLIHCHGSKDAGVSTSPRSATLPRRRRTTRMALGFGVLHGAAGASHLFAALPALALAPSARVVYLAAYLSAAPLVMVGVGALVGSLGQLGQSPTWGERLSLGSGLLAVVVGLFWIVSGINA